MWPIRRDFRFFLRRMLYNLGLRPRMECVQRFNYVEKAEYWALVWGTAVMVVTGVDCQLWLESYVYGVKSLPPVDRSARQNHREE